MSSAPSDSQRRSKRKASTPLRLQEEQAGLQLQQQEEKDLQRALKASQEEFDVEEESDEDLSILEHDDEEEEKEEGPTLSLDSTWKQEIYQVVLPPFKALSGPQVPFSDPLDLLHLFLPYSLLALIATNTTAYAHSKGTSSDWGTTPDELFVFIAAHICMGICVYPQVHMYWSQEYHLPFISQCFSRNRFKELLRYFHIAPLNESSATSSPLGKVQLLLDFLAVSFASFYKPDRELTVDEAMVGFKGRSTLKQYIPSKPTKWGYKIWCLCNHNYTLAFKVCEGARSGNESVTAAEAALELVRPYHNHNRILYMDRLFTSPNLLATLLENKTRGCGTVRNNRVGLPEEFKRKEKEMKSGEMECWQKGNMGALVWKDRRLVYMLTTYVSPKTTQRVLRKGRSKKQRVPRVILDYNKFKGGVDTVDQLRDSYAIGRKSLKWWPRLAWWCIDICIVNAYSLHCINDSNPMTHLQFRERLMHQLLEKYGQHQGSREGKRQKIARPNQDQHQLVFDGFERDCSICSRGRLGRKQTTYKCELCDIFLCITPCYDIHRKAS